MYAVWIEYTYRGLYMSSVYYRGVEFLAKIILCPLTQVYTKYTVFVEM